MLGARPLLQWRRALATGLANRGREEQIERERERERAPPEMDRLSFNGFPLPAAEKAAAGHSKLEQGTVVLEAVKWGLYSVVNVNVESKHSN